MMGLRSIHGVNTSLNSGDLRRYIQLKESDTESAPDMLNLLVL
jgi:hypothetical protein